MDIKRIKNKKFLFIGSLDDKRNLLYLGLLEHNAKFDYDYLSWNSFLNKIDKNYLLNFDLVRLSSPWFDRSVSNILSNAKEVELKGLDKNKIDFNFYNLLDKSEKLLMSLNVLNPPNSIKIMRNKEETEKLLLLNNIPTPRNYKFQNLEELIESLEEKPIFIKPKTGSLGVGLSLVERNKFGVLKYILVDGKDDKYYYGKDAYNILKKNISNFSNYIFQDYISSRKICGNSFDMRVLLNMDKNKQFKYLRTSSSNSIGTNISLGGRSIFDVEKYIPENKLEIVSELVEKTSNSFKNLILGVDIIFDEDNNPYVLEVNAFPGIKSPLNFGYNPYLTEINYLNNNLSIWENKSKR